MSTDEEDGCTCSQVSEVHQIFVLCLPWSIVEHVGPTVKHIRRAKESRSVFRGRWGGSEDRHKSLTLQQNRPCGIVYITSCLLFSYFTPFQKVFRIPPAALMAPLSALCPSVGPDFISLKLLSASFSLPPLNSLSSPFCPLRLPSFHKFTAHPPNIHTHFCVPLSLSPSFGWCK